MSLELRYRSKVDNDLLDKIMTMWYNGTKR